MKTAFRKLVKEAARCGEAGRHIIIYSRQNKCFSNVPAVSRATFRKTGKLASGIDLFLGGEANFAGG